MTFIESAVAAALKPDDPEPDLEAHRILMRLATGPDGKVRLVTTNFDRLFESCDASVASQHALDLKQPEQIASIDGIIHLHGRVDDAYENADGGPFVLSTTNFGSAYLAQGWATDFVKSLLSKYLVVFVGYSADDPPIRYLLEGLGRDAASQGNVYAFQVAGDEEANLDWEQRGVSTIAVSESKTIVLYGKR